MTDLQRKAACFRYSFFRLEKQRAAADAKRTDTDKHCRKNMPCKYLALHRSLGYLFPSVHESTEKGADEAAQLVHVPRFILR